MDHLTTRPPAPRRDRRTSLGLAVVAAALLAVGSPGLVLAWDNNSFSGASENEMLTLINQARAANGLPALNENNALQDVARWRSKDMNDRDYFSHNIPNPPGGKVFDELHRRGICYEVAGENIGVNNYPDDVATQTMFNGWMNSPGHRALILGDGFNRIGLGAYKGTGGDYPNHYWTAVFTHGCGGGGGGGGGGDPDPTPKPPKQTPKPPKPDPDPTRRPDRTPRPEPAATPEPIAAPTPAPIREPTPEITPGPEDLGPVVDSSVWLALLAGAGIGPGAGGANLAGGATWQVIEPPPSMGLLDTIVGGVVAAYLGK